MRDDKSIITSAKKVFALNVQLSTMSLADPRRLGLLTQRDKLVAAILRYDALRGRSGPWELMPSGKRFWLHDPRPEDVDVGDIARSLSQLCRFSGRLKHYYSVSQHSVLVSRHVRPEAALAGLLHDASEAYIGDVVSPVKRLLPEYRVLEDAIMRAVCLRFGLDFDDEGLWREVKRADQAVLSAEFRDVAGRARLEVLDEPPIDEKIRPQSAAHARKGFLERFGELYGEGAVG